MDTKKNIIIMVIASLLIGKTYAMELTKQEITADLFKAVWENNLSSIKSAIEKGADVNAASVKYGDKTPLGLAIVKFEKADTVESAMKVIELLLNNNANPNNYRITGARIDYTIHKVLSPETSSSTWKPRYTLFRLLYEHGAKIAKTSDEKFKQSAYSQVIDHMNESIQNLKSWPHEEVKDGLKIGLLALNLLDEKYSRADKAFKKSIYNDSFKNLFLTKGIQSCSEKLKELDKEIKQDLEACEKEYQNTFKNRPKNIMLREFSGRYPLFLSKKSFIYNGRSYSIKNS